MSQDMHKSLVELIHFAESVGWKRKVLVNGVVELTSYQGKIVRVPNTRQMNASKLSTLTAKIVRGTDPKLVATFNAASELHEAGADPAEIAAAFPDAEAIAERFYELEETETEVKVPKPVVEPPHIVSEAPWMAHKRPGSGSEPGQLYESATTIERLWSDHHRDYVCTFPGCGYESRKARSVAMHFGAKHSRGQDPVPKPAKGDELDDPTYIEPLSRRSSVKRLAREIELAMRTLYGSPEKIEIGGGAFEMWTAHLAEEIIRRRIENRVPIDGTADEPRAEMTAEEIVSAVRQLVDRGHVARIEQRLAELEADHNALVTRRFEEESLRAEAERKQAAAEAQVQALQERLHRLTADLNTARELFASINPEGELV